MKLEFDHDWIWVGIVVICMIISFAWTAPGLVTNNSHCTCKYCTAGTRTASYQTVDGASAAHAHVPAPASPVNSQSASTHEYVGHQSSAVSVTSVERERKTQDREEIAFRVLKQYFPNNCKRRVRPPFLVNPHTKRRLEYDVYCGPPINLSVECDGYQHFFFDSKNRFHRTREEFEAQLARDRLKDELSATNGVKLIRIPYTVKTKHIPSYLSQQLDSLLFHNPERS